MRTLVPLRWYTRYRQPRPRRVRAAAGQSASRSSVGGDRARCPTRCRTVRLVVASSKATRCCRDLAGWRRPSSVARPTVPENSAGRSSAPILPPGERARSFRSGSSTRSRSRSIPVRIPVPAYRSPPAAPVGVRAADHRRGSSPPLAGAAPGCAASAFTAAPSCSRSTEQFLNGRARSRSTGIGSTIRSRPEFADRSTFASDAGSYGRAGARGRRRQGGRTAVDGIRGPGRAEHARPGAASRSARRLRRDSGDRSELTSSAPAYAAIGRIPWAV